MPWFPARASLILGKAVLSIQSNCAAEGQDQLDTVK